MRQDYQKGEDVYLVTNSGKPTMEKIPCTVIGVRYVEKKTMLRMSDRMVTGLYTGYVYEVDVKELEGNDVTPKCLRKRPKPGDDYKTILNKIKKPNGEVVV